MEYATTIDLDNLYFPLVADRNVESSSNGDIVTIGRHCDTPSSHATLIPQRDSRAHKAITTQANRGVAPQLLKPNTSLSGTNERP